MKIIYSLLIFISTYSFAQNNTIVPPSNLIVQGIPDIPSSIKQDVARYTESRSAAFADWHPLHRSMLIATRFGNVPQIHMVNMPGGARKQMSMGFSLPSYSVRPSVSVAP